MFNINVARFADKLRSALGIQGAAAFAGAHDTLQPSIVIEVDRPEWGFAANEILISLSHRRAAGGAGAVSKVGIINATASGALCIVTDLWTFGNGFQHGLHTQAALEALTGFAYGGDQTFRDTRFGAGAVANFGVRAFAALGGASIGGGSHQRLMDDFGAFVNSAGEYHHAAHAILAPGTGLTIEHGTDNSELRVTFFARVVPLFKGVRG